MPLILWNNWYVIHIEVVLETDVCHQSSQICHLDNEIHIASVVVYSGDDQYG